MTYTDAIVLGLFQGLTGLLPISSIGHLLLIKTLLGINNEQGFAFAAVMQLASALAIFVYFFPDIWMLTQTLLRKLGRLPTNKKDEIILYALIAGTIPAVVLSLAVHANMPAITSSPLFVAGFLVVGSIFFMYAEYVYMYNPRDNEMTFMKGLKIGLFQILSLLPGMTQSGTTISGGMLFGLSRSEAARFAFLLAIPIIIASGAQNALDLIVSNQQVSWFPLLSGALVAFFTSLLAVHFLLSFLRSHTLWPFIWYRIILAGFLIFVFCFG